MIYLIIYLIIGVWVCAVVLPVVRWRHYDLGPDRGRPPTLRLQGGQAHMTSVSQNPQKAGGETRLRELLNSQYGGFA